MVALFAVQQLVVAQQTKGLLIDVKDNSSDIAGRKVFTDSAKNNIMMWFQSRPEPKPDGNTYKIAGLDVVKVTDAGVVLKRLSILNNDYYIYNWPTAFMFTPTEKYLRIKALPFVSPRKQLDLLYTFDDELNIIRTDTFSNTIFKLDTLNTHEWSTIKIGNHWLDYNSYEISYYNYKWYFLQYDSTHQLISYTPYTTKKTTWELPIILDDGNIMFIGLVGSTYIYEPPNHRGSHSYRMALLKTTPKGETLWYKEFDEPNYSAPIGPEGEWHGAGTFPNYAIKLSNGNIAISGYMDRTGFLMTVNQQGQVLWCRKTDKEAVAKPKMITTVPSPTNSGGQDYISGELNGITEKNGSIYATGRFDEYMAADSSLMTCFPVPRQYKFNLNGDLLWTRSYYYQYNSFGWLDNVIHKGDSLLYTGSWRDTLTMRNQDIWFLKTDTNGCVVPNCHKNDVISPYTSVRNNDIIANYNFVLYPNPTSGLLFIEGGNLSEIKNIHVTNTQGQIVKVLSPNFSSNKISVDLSPLSSGKYYLEISGDKFRMVEQIVVKN